MLPLNGWGCVRRRGRHPEVCWWRVMEAASHSEQDAMPPQMMTPSAIPRSQCHHL